mgnify:FL=1
MNIQTPLPASTAHKTFPVSLKSVKWSQPTLLTGIDDAKPGDITMLSTYYVANFYENETVAPHLDALFLVGENGHEPKLYYDLTGTARAQGAQILIEHLYRGGGGIHSDVLDWNMVFEPEHYTVNVITFAGVRIIMNACVLQDPEYFFDELEDYEAVGRECIHPCVIEVYGDKSASEMKKIAMHHLKYMIALLPDNLRPDLNMFRFVD